MLRTDLCVARPSYRHLSHRTSPNRLMNRDLCEYPSTVSPSVLQGHTLVRGGVLRQEMARGDMALQNTGVM